MSKKKPAEQFVAAAQLKSADLVDKADMPRERKDPRDMRAYLGMAAEIAEDLSYIRNTRFPNAIKHFPVDPILRTVDKYFPHAKGGPLYVDTPITKRDIAECKLKAVAMATEGVRYCYIDPEMTIRDVQAQLEVKRGVA